MSRGSAGGTDRSAQAPLIRPGCPGWLPDKEAGGRLSPRKAHRRDRQRAKKPMNRRQIRRRRRATPNSGSGSGDGFLPAEALFASARELLLPYLDEPRTEADVAAGFDVRRHQARSWLERLVADGAIEKLPKPVRGWGSERTDSPGAFDPRPTQDGDPTPEPLVHRHSHPPKFSSPSSLQYPSKDGKHRVGCRGDGGSVRFVSRSFSA